MAPIPPKPAVFTPEAAPVGVGVDYVSFWQSRGFIKPRIQLAHTNAANGQGSIESSKQWAESAPGAHTLPHYQVDRDGRACKFLPTNRKGIANQTVAEYRGSHGTVQDWSLAYETADTGTIDDPTISDYTDVQAETLATIFAYESIVHGIPLELPTEWYGSGTASHTDPFGYPYWTNARGKTCPGAKKKARLRSEILLRAQTIVTAWQGGDNPIPEEELTVAQVDDILQAIAALNGRIDGIWDVINQTNAQLPATGDGETVKSHLERLKWMPTTLEEIKAQIAALESAPPG